MILLITILSILFLTDPGDEISQSTAVMEQVKVQLAAIYHSSDYRFQVIEKWIPKKIKSLEAEEIRNLKFESPQPKGYQMIRLTFQDKKIIEEVTIQVFVEVKRRLPVAARRIMPGEPVAPNLFNMTWVDISRLRGNYISDIILISGKSARRLIPKGSILHLKDFQKKPIVSPGDLVHMEYVSKGISVVIPCFAQGSAARGEQIKLFNKETGEHYIGQVQSVRNVKWEKTL